MKKYSIKETAEMLGTSEENVCRWIRHGKIKATSSTLCAEGTNGADDVIKGIADEIPNYAQSMATSISDIIINSAKFVRTVIQIIKENDTSKDFEVDSDEVKRILGERIELSRTSVEAKKQLLKKLEEQIEAEEEKLNKREELKEEIGIDNDADLNNNDEQ